MSSMQLPSSDEKDRIQILLEEYRTLRNEIVNRTGNRFGIVGFVLPLIIGIAAQSGSALCWSWLLFASAAALLLAVWLRLAVLIKRCSTRVAEIERRVNKSMGEDLLIWETSIAARGAFHIFFRLARETSIGVRGLLRKFFGN